MTEQPPPASLKSRPPHIAGRSRFGWVCFWIYWLIFALLEVGEISNFFSTEPTAREATSAFLFRIAELFVIFLVPYWIWMWLLYYSPKWVRKMTKFGAIILALFGFSE